MQYQVPQFIEVEDKIFGPLTFKQFVYLGGGGGLCLIFFSIFPLYITFILSIPVVAFSLTLAFYKVNGRPFIYAMEHAFGYFFASKLYLWKQREPQAQKTKEDKSILTSAAIVPTVSQNRLKDLAWSLNIKDRAKMDTSASDRRNFEL